MSEPAVASPTKPMTTDEFWDFVHRPDNQNRWFELHRGEVIELSRPTRRHGAVTSNITIELGLYARMVRRGYVASNDSGVILAEEPASVVGPDVAYFTDANTLAEIHPKWGEEVPLLAVEVMSPNDRPNTLLAKIRDYLRNGVKVVWLVDYEDRTVSVHLPNLPPDVFTEAQELTGGDVLPGLTCRVADFFRMPAELPMSAPPPAA